MKGIGGYGNNERKTINVVKDDAYGDVRKICFIEIKEKRNSP